MTRRPVVPIMDETPVQPPPSESNMPSPSENVDTNMPDAAQPTGPAEEKGFGDAYPITDVREGGAVAAPGSGESKRRKVTPQAHIHNLFGSTLRSLSRIIDNQEVCVNCLSSEHKIEDCPKDGALEWKAALLSIQDGFAARQAEIDVEVIHDDDELPDVEQDARQDTTPEGVQDADQASKDETIASKRDNILMHPEAKPRGDYWSKGVDQCACRGEKPEGHRFQEHPSHVRRIA